MTLWHIRNFIKYNDVGLMNPHGYKANFYALSVAKFTKTPCVATCHPWTETKYNARARFYTRVDKRMLTRMDDLVAVSENVRAAVSEIVPGKSCRVIPNGIDLHRFNGQVNAGGYRESLWLSEDDFVIGAIGRLVPEKGYRYLIEAMQQLSADHPHLKLLIIGDGPLNNELSREVARRQLQGNVIFTGVRDDVPQLLATMNAFVLSSVSEGLPIVVLEAMAAGKPVVATGVGDVPKVIVSGQNGLLTAPGDAAALAKAIDWVIKNPKKAQQMGKAASQYVAENYSARAMAHQYVQVFEQFRKK